MSNYSIINLKTDPELKKEAAKTADMLGISLSAVLNNELKRFVVEKSVLFEVPEVPNAKTTKELSDSKKEIESGNYYKFKDNKESLSFLADKMK